MSDYTNAVLWPLETRLRKTYHEIRNAHLAYRIPSLTERDDALKRGQALPEMLEYMNKANHDPDLNNAHVHFGYPFGPPTGDHALFAVAVLRRLGYGVTLAVDPDLDACTIRLDRCGFQVATPLKTAEDYGIHLSAKLQLAVEVSLPGTAPAQLARRGVLWCIPRFKRWAKRTKEHMYAPGGNGARRAAERFAVSASQ